MPLVVPILLVAGLVGYIWYQRTKQAAPGGAATTAGTAAVMQAQAGAFMPAMHQSFRAHSPSVEDQVHGWAGQAGEYGLRPDLARHGVAHIPVVEDQVAAAAAMYPRFGMHPRDLISPVWMQVLQVQIPRPAQADLLKQVRLKNVRGFYKTNLVMRLYGLYVGDPRDMRTYVWYLGPDIGMAPRNPALD